MAKVTNQTIIGNDETYIDADGQVYYFGEFFRHVMTEAYPLPSLNPSGVARKTPKGYRPTDQGDGSPKQYPYRACFSECAARWNALPDHCTDIISCEDHSARELVWQAKVAQGVSCSYYDLYMRCCMSNCTIISVTGPDGSAHTGGALPSPDPCFPCGNPGACEDQAIEYTTNQMFIRETQTFHVDNPSPFKNYRWALSGGGTIEPTEGIQTLYTAPEENPYCAENATIQLYACDMLCDTVFIAISLAGDKTPAGFVYDDTYDGDCHTVPGESYYICNFQLGQKHIFCDGTEEYTTTGCGAGCVGYPDVCNEGVCMNAYPGGAQCEHKSVTLGALSGTTWDDRSENLKAQGCCPSQLM